MQRVLSLFFMLLAVTLQAQEIRLSNRFVIDVTIDAQDRIWVGTEEGLNCYDGIRNRVFRKSADGLMSDSINGVLADRNDPLVWVALQKAGLACYDLQNDSFSVYRAGEAEDTLPDDDLTHVEQAPDGSIWVSSFTKGIARLDKETGKFERYNAGSFEGMRDLPLHTFKFRGDQLVLGYWEDGVSILSLTDHSRIDLRYDPDDPYSLPSDEVRSVLVDSNNRIWVGTAAGLALYSEAGRHFTVFRHQEGAPGSLPDGTIFKLKEDAQGRLVVAAGSGFVASLDIRGAVPAPEDNPFTVLNSSASGDHPAIRAVETDRFGNIWLGTYGGGLQFLPGHQPALGTIPLFARNPDSRETQSLWFDSEDRLVAGSSSGLVAEVTGRPGESILAELGNEIGPVLSLLQDRDGIWWIGTEQGGLFRSDGKHPRFIPLSDQNLAVRALLEDGPSLWVGSSRGLFLLDRKSGRIMRQWSFREGTLPDDLVRSLLKDSAGRLWVGSYGHGLTVFDADMEQQAHYELSSGFLSDQVNHIIEDHLGRIWVATADGLARFDAGPESVSSVMTEFDSLPGENIRALAEDGSGRIWMSLNDGVGCLGRDGKTAFFDSRDGLPDGNYFSAAVTGSPKGRIFFGTTGGVAWIEPSALLSDIRIPPVVFLTSPEDLSVDYRNNYLLVRFCVPDHFLARSVEYAYRLPDLDPDWHPCGPELEFHQLPYGHHTLQVRARLHSMEWEEELSSIPLYVRPPFWLTWWAKAFYILLILAVLVGSILYMTRRINRKNREKLQQDRQLQERQVGEERMVFYTNVTHELRTPLTLILGPLADLSEDKEVPPQVRSRIGKVKQSAQQLLGLVNQLLEFRRTETKNRALTVGYEDLSRFVEEVGQRFRDLSIDKAVSIVLAVEPDIRLWFDAEALTIILNNLLSNAQKFTPSGKIVLSLQRENGAAVIKVSDTGCGIAAEDLEHIFERYFQVNGPQHASGSGIGLALVKNLCDLHHIDLQVSSSPGQGTEFRLRLDPAEDYPEARRLSPLPEESEEESVPAEDNARLRILIVEDNAEIREYIRESLASEYNVLQADQGREGLKIAIREIPDIIVSDIMMPVMDGIAFCKAIRQDVRTSHIPVILLTAKGSDEARVEGYNVGADSYLVKPFHKALLLSRIHNILDTRQRLMRQVSESGTAEDLSPVDNEFLVRYTEFVQEHLGDEKIDIVSLAGQFAMSQSTLYRKVKAVSGLSPNELIRNIRLNKAAELLKKTDLSISEISWQVGFGSPVYFRSCFKDRFGKTPSEYREKRE
ncbi:MAG: helix-turn-helix domain-containing protein [Bacteroidales bacterium]|nr:helix-turn-helix domain-containing protein [Bacteroidales bacterium]